jgi:hypothetical protein
MTQDPESAFRRVFLENLVEQHAYVAGDLIAIDGETWAVHGTILVDGDVLMAEYHQADDAKADLQRLAPNLSDL